MKKRWGMLGLAAAVALAAGAVAYDRMRERLFQEVCPTWDWRGVLGEHYTVAGESGEPFSISVADLRTVLQQVTVRRAPKTDLLAIPGLSFQITTGDGSALSITIGADGSLSCARWDDLEGTRTFWTTVDETVYEELLALGGAV